MSLGSEEKQVKSHFNDRLPPLGQVPTEAVDPDPFHTTKPQFPKGLSGDTNWSSLRNSGGKKAVRHPGLP